MSYQVLARKWRPRKFSELMGQEHVVRALAGGLNQGRLHHAFLFTGTRGVGKTTIARIIAKSLNCEVGVSAEPCGECGNCRDIDAGRFIDLYEIDAASTTRVEDTRDMLEKVIYAPSRGRFKVYLIDEVHMLSNHSFNALLKTLEEPPEHVKFLLATTDPQKLPVTVLSRCLKFSLKRLTVAQISQQMRHILAAENIPFEAEAIDELARGADGSMRDGLSLLDQAIGFGAGSVQTNATREMLGTISRDVVFDLLEALARGDATDLSNKLADFGDFGGSYTQVLARLMETLHQLAFLQTVGPAAKQLGEIHPRLQALVDQFSPQDLQVKFQFAGIAVKEVAAAPDPRIAFEMCLLRMHAFAEIQNAAGAEHDRLGKTNGSGVAIATPEPVLAKTPKISVVETLASPKQENRTYPTAHAPEAIIPPKHAADAPLAERWLALVRQLELPPGPIRELAHNALVREWRESSLVLVIDAAHAALSGSCEALKSLISQQLEKTIQLSIQIADVDLSASPAQSMARENAQMAQNFSATISENPLVKSLIREFEAKIIPGSIKFNRPIN